jgi:hypothetical protein
MKNEYTENLERLVRQMLTPLKNIPFNLIIEGITRYSVIPFDKKNKNDLEILDKLILSANNAGKEINKEGILKTRQKERVNAVESYVKNALNNVGFIADTPKTNDGKRKSTGYPDIEFKDSNGNTNYLECKTFNINNINTTQRSFYLSPSDKFKVTANAHHFILSYELFVANSFGKKYLFKCKSWKILTIEEIYCDVKYEFNTSNKRLYLPKSILAEGEIK